LSSLKIADFDWPRSRGCDWACISEESARPPLADPFQPSQVASIKLLARQIRDLAREIRLPIPERTASGVTPAPAITWTGIASRAWFGPIAPAGVEPERYPMSRSPALRTWARRMSTAPISRPERLGLRRRANRSIGSRP